MDDINTNLPENLPTSAASRSMKPGVKVMRQCVLVPVGLVSVSQGVHNLGLVQACYDTLPASRSVLLVQAPH